MTVPLILLAGATVGVGFLGAPQAGSVFADWVYFGAPPEEKFMLGLALLSTVVAVAGILVGYSMYNVRKAVDPMESALGPVWKVLLNRYYIDAFYMHWIVYPIRDTWSADVNWFNQHVIDGIVNGAAALARGLSKLVSWFDRNVIDGFLNGVAGITGETGGLLKYLQSGNVQWYAVGLFAGVITLTVFFIRLS
jgi:NADH:ubiquinone oxidoreductase subunit 5 (chain L)/Multisubunit Na+/H+ antiporter, MnhA subunit